MKASPQLPADAAVRGTLFDRARKQGLAQELTDQVILVVKQQETKKRAVRRSVGALALLFGLGLWVATYFRSTDSIITHSAHRQTLALNDGSRADLNARTQIKTDFRYGRRTVHLSEGEVFFTVAKDTEHPFLVETPSGTIRVTGTAFNVRLLPDRSAEVTLVEGSVAIQQSGKDSALSSGEQLTFGAGRDQLTQLSFADLENVTAWREGRLVLDEVTVVDAVARMAHYHGKRIEVAPEVAEIRLGGSCPLDDLTAFLHSLKATQAIDISENRDGSYLVRSRQP